SPPFPTRRSSDLVDESERGERVEFPDGLADWYLIAAHDAEVRRDKGDRAAEVDVLLILDAEVQFGVAYGLRLRIGERELDRGLGVCVGVVGAVDNVSA